MKQKFYQLTVSKAHEKTATAAGVRDRARSARAQAPQGALEMASPKSTAEKAGEACASLLFAELSIGLVNIARFNSTINAPLYDLPTEALNPAPGFAFATA